MDFDAIKEDIIDIINSKTNVVDKDKLPDLENDTFTYGNGVRTWVGSIFVDIRNSSEMFKEENSEKLARVMRAFSNGIIKILKSDINYRQIGIRGDCVYGIYTIPNQDDTYKMFDLAIQINTFIKLYNKVLKENNFDTFDAGIGVGMGKDLVIKAGLSRTGINDMIWIGDSVVDASNLCGMARKKSNSYILLSSMVHNNIIKKWNEKHDKSQIWFKYNSLLKCYECNAYYDGWNI